MYMSGQDIVRPLTAPLKKDSHLVVLYGNLAPEGAVAKITGKEGERFEGRARVFEGEERATQAILAGRVRAGDVVVIRGEGPRGGPGMREMLVRTGERITIDALKRELQVDLSAAELRRRRAAWKPPKPYATRGALGKYAQLVGSASQGAVTVPIQARRRNS
jgi:dihydroxy-acid dehydratase